MARLCGKIEGKRHTMKEHIHLHEALQAPSPKHMNMRRNMCACSGGNHVVQPHRNDHISRDLTGFGKPERWQLKDQR